MLDVLPDRVNNYIFIKYEDLINNFENTINKIKNKGLKIKNNINFPLNLNYYKNNKDKKFKKIKNDIINYKLILNNSNFIEFYEKKLNYI